MYNCFECDISKSLYMYVLFVLYFPIMEDIQIITQTPKMSIDDLYFFCSQSLMATLNLLATNVSYFIITDVITQVMSC